jgi:uncharacterized protein (TIGR03085 family)
MTDIAAAERAALADLLESVGPDAPTLCSGWLTRDLAAHIIARERRPDASGGIVLRPLAGYLKRVQRGIAARDWAELVAEVRHPPWWSPISNPLLNEATNRIELFIHHEDVRRAQDGWRPRPLTPEVSAALWRRVRAVARLVLRRTPATITVTAAGLGEVRAGRGGPEVRLAGEPQELLLFLTGRQAHALVELTGPDKITDRMRRGRYGI